jgi:hypothetical protein
MNKFCFIGGIIISNTYTYFLIKIYINRNYLLIPNKNIPKNEQFKLEKKL